MLKRTVFILLLLLPAGFAQAPAAGQPSSEKLASDKIAPEKLAAYAGLAEKWMVEYIQVDTANPPGNEARAAAFYKQVFDAEGIENQVYEVAPGRANIWARIPASGSAKQRPLVMLNHEDVVSSVASRWKHPPFAGAIDEGYLYGRGAQDMKGEGLAQLVVMVMLKREQVALERDVIFLATADEEVDGIGTDWVIQKKPELLGNAEFLVTEGGENLEEHGKVKYVGLDVAEKSPYWLVLTAHGRPGHGSKPLENSAPNRLVRALNRVIAWHTEMKALPVTAEFMRRMAADQPAELAAKFSDVTKAMKDAKFVAWLERQEGLAYMFRNTVTLTQMEGSGQTNVIPSVATAHLDVRLLPGEKPEEFLAAIRKVVGDPEVTVEPESKTFREANMSSTDNPLFRGIEQVAARYFPGAPVLPRLNNGYTENQRFRQLGVVSYGFSPYQNTAEETASEHGDNERIRVEQIRRGYRVLFDLVTSVAGAK
ncbi:MAG: M20/M25/M40 family metallo-hydrolase [Candidatus Koribacter versatilis]|uniref:M20/M25/M40 family metallo-hydrolase n=1 Tax=Candidatus Korobacter versatilis TaxID=658062 RepID=A0A932A970_9BACT|nr:M20/M25/M40 family metallo-hydrolase [Candidatus Koribacter versatilis]